MAGFSAGSISTRLRLDSKAFESGLKRAEDKADLFGKNVSQSIGDKTAGSLTKTATAIEKTSQSVGATLTQTAVVGANLRKQAAAPVFTSERSLVGFQQAGKLAKGLTVAFAGLTKGLGLLRNAATLVPRAFKAIAGSIFSLRNVLISGGILLAFRALTKSASEIDRLTTSFRELAFSFDIGATEALLAFRKAAKGTIDDLGLLQAANAATQLGVASTVEQFELLIEGGRRLGQVMGRTASEGIDDLSTGIGRQSRLILDNLGLIISVEKATAAYAKRLGVSTKDLDDNQKKLAFNEAAYEAIRQKTAQLGPEQDTLSLQLARVGAASSNLFTEIAQRLTPALGRFYSAIEQLQRSDFGFINAFSGAIENLIDIATVFIDEVLPGLFRRLTTLTEAAETVFALGRDSVRPFLQGFRAALSQQSGGMFVIDLFSRALDSLVIAARLFAKVLFNTFRDEFTNALAGFADTKFGKALQNFAGSALGRGLFGKELAEALDFKTIEEQAESAERRLTGLIKARDRLEERLLASRSINVTTRQRERGVVATVGDATAPPLTRRQIIERARNIGIDLPTTRRVPPTQAERELFARRGDRGGPGGGAVPLSFKIEDIPTRELEADLVREINKAIGAAQDSIDTINLGTFRTDELQEETDKLKDSLVGLVSQLPGGEKVVKGFTAATDRLRQVFGETEPAIKKTELAAADLADTLVGLDEGPELIGPIRPGLSEKDLETIEAQQKRQRLAAEKRARDEEEELLGRQRLLRELTEIAGEDVPIPLEAGLQRLRIAANNLREAQLSGVFELTAIRAAEFAKVLDEISAGKTVEELNELKAAFPGLLKAIDDASTQAVDALAELAFPEDIGELDISAVRELQAIASKGDITAFRAAAERFVQSVNPEVAARFVREFGKLTGLTDEIERRISEAFDASTGAGEQLRLPLDLSAFEELRSIAQGNDLAAFTAKFDSLIEKMTPEEVEDFFRRYGEYVQAATDKTETLATLARELLPETAETALPVPVEDLNALLDRIEASPAAVDLEAISRLLGDLSIGLSPEQVEQVQDRIRELADFDIETVFAAFKKLPIALSPEQLAQVQSRLKGLAGDITLQNIQTALADLTIGLTPEEVERVTTKLRELGDAREEAEGEIEINIGRLSRGLGRAFADSLEGSRSLLDSLAGSFASSLEDGLTDAIDGVLSLLSEQGGLLGSIGGFLGSDTFQGLLGLGASLASQQSGSEVRELPIEEIATSSSAVRGVVAGPQSVAIAQVGTSLREANRGVEQLLREIRDTLRSGQTVNFNSGGLGSAGTV